MISFNCAPELNEIINHPEVIGGHILDAEPPIDITPALERGGFGVLGEGYGFLLDAVTPGVVEVHTSILPEYRQQSRAITLASMDEVFTQTNVTDIVTRIRNNPPARQLAVSCGMQKLFERDGFEFFGIGLHRWAAQCDRFTHLGQKFHETLEAAGVETDHGEDSNHDQYVGITFEMGKKMPGKAQHFYNTWARLAGFHPLEILSMNPVTAYIGNAVVELVNDEVRVVCQQQQ